FAPYLVLIAALLALAPGSLPPARAQGIVNAWTTTGLNLRAGPGEDYAIIASLPAQTGIVVEARNDEMTWVIGHTVDGRWRGWILGELLFFDLGVDVAALPVSYEIPAAPNTSGTLAGRAPIYEAVDL